MNVDFNNVRLGDYIYDGNSLLHFGYSEEKNLFDGETIERFVSLSFVLREFDKEEQWSQFLEKCNWIERFIIIVDASISEGNKMTMIFLESTLKAIAVRMLQKGKDIAFLFGADV